MDAKRTTKRGKGNSGPKSGGANQRSDRGLQSWVETPIESGGTFAQDEVTAADGILRKFFADLEHMRRDFVETKNPDKLIGHLRIANVIGRVSGIMRAFTVKTLVDNWQGDVDPSEYIAGATGLAPSTQKVYYNTAKTLDGLQREVGWDVYYRMLSRDMRDLIRIAQHANEHGLSAADIETIAEAPTRSALLEKLDSLSGRNVVSRLLITEDKDGILWAVKKRKKPTNVGMLNVDNDDPDAQAAIARIRRSAGIVQQ